MDHIPKLINKEENAVLRAIQNCEEANKIVFNLNEDSSFRPDGLSRKLYQTR